MSIITRYDSPPSGYEATDATHYVHFPWSEDWTVSSWHSNPALEERGNGDIATTSCTELYAEIPRHQGEADIITSLGHKSLVIVNREAVGSNGGWHNITVVNSGPNDKGLVGFVRVEDLKKLPGIPHSLPISLKCQEKQQSFINDVCQLGVPAWYNTTEPYYDELSCEYLVSVTTRYTATGGEALQQRMMEHIPEGITQLLEYYNKRRDPETIAYVTGAFKFAEAKSWNLNISEPDSQLKVLVAIPARYFDAIPQERQDLSNLDAGSIRSARLVSSKLEDQVDNLIALMTKYHQDSRWRKVALLHNGPRPFYGEFSFSEESKKIGFFLSNLKRLLVLNEKTLRTQSDDIIEIGFNEQFEVQYILLNDDEGSHDLKVGFNRLKKTEPFNYPRTMAYVFYLFEISSELRRSGQISGGWATFLKKYTFPPPTVSPSTGNRNGRCRPTITDPFKCMGPEFDEYRKRHLRDFKCDTLPPEQRIGLTEFGEMGYQAVQTGASEDFNNKFAPFKTEPAKFFEETDIETFKLQIQEENAIHGGTLDFVGDPFVENISNDLRNGYHESSEWYGIAAARVRNKIFADVVQPFNINAIIARAHQCICQDFQLVIEEAELNGAPPAELIALRAQAAAAGCENPCSIIPVLCSCIPLPWPPKFRIPMQFDIVDIMGYITALVINAIVEAIVKFLVDLIKNLLLKVLDCDRSKTFPRQRNFINTFKESYPWEDDETPPELAAALRQNQIPEELARPELINALIKDVSLILTPREFCELFSGQARVATLETVNALIVQKYPELSATFSNLERVKVLFVSVGSTIDPSICRNLDELLTAVDDEPAGYICEETNLREDMAAGRATAEQINEMLAEASKCQTDQLSSLINLIQTLTGDGDIFAGIVPPVFKTPNNPNGIIPRDPPSVQFLKEVADDGLFTGIEAKFYSEMNSNVPTLVTTEESDEPASESSAAGALSALLPNIIPPAPQSNFVKNIANGLAVNLQTLEPSIGEGRTLISLNMPRRPILPRPEDVNAGFSDNLYRMTAFPGLPVNRVEIEPIRQEQININYSVCEDSPTTTTWSRIRDAYTVQIEDREPEGDPNIILNFDGLKKINPEFIQSLGALRGVGAPSQEAFDNILMSRWSEVPWGVGIPRDINSPTSELAVFHRNAGFKDVTRDLIKQIAGSIRRSRFLDGTQSFAAAFDNLTSVEFSPHPTCNPRAPGILNIPDVRSKMSERYRQDPSENPQRYINSVQYAIILAYLRVAIVQVGIDGIFAFSQFNAEDVLKSDTTMAYLLNRVRTELRYGSYQDDYDSSSGPAPPYENFYNEVRAAVSSIMFDRKYILAEDLQDPFTGEPVDVQLDAGLINETLRRSLHEPELIAESVDIGELRRTESATSEGEESVRRCNAPSGLRSATRTTEDGVECEPESDSNANNETSSGEIDPDTARKRIGYLEFFFKEQLKTISAEMQVLFQSEIGDINTKMLGGYARLVDVPEGAPIAGARFFKPFQGQVTVNEEDINPGLVNLINIVSELEVVDEDTGVGLPVEGDTAINALLERFEENPESFPSGTFSRYRSALRRGENLVDIIRQELAASVLRDHTEDLTRNQLLNPHFEYLKDGGFVVEKYIKITELKDTTWDAIAEVTPIAVEKIKNRDASLKGIVSLAAWERYLTDLVFWYDGELRMVETRNNEISFNIGKYFDKWEWGARLVYVYPIGQDQSEPRRTIQDNLTNNGQPLNESVAAAIQAAKAYTLKEKVDLGAVINSSDIARLENVEIFGDPRMYEVTTVPILTREVEALGSDVIPEVAGLDFPTAFDHIYGLFMENLYNPADEIIRFWRREIEGTYRTENQDGLDVSISNNDGLIHRCPALPPRAREWRQYRRQHYLVPLNEEQRAAYAAYRQQANEYNRTKNTPEAIAACDALQDAYENLNSLQTDGIDRPEIICEQVRDGERWITECRPVGEVTEEDTETRSRPGAMYELNTIKEGLDALRTRVEFEQNPDNSTNRTSLVGQIEYSQGWPEGFGMLRMLDLIQKEMMAPDFFTGESPIEKCFVDGDRFNNVVSNRRGNIPCAEYDNLFNMLRSLRLYLNAFQTGSPGTADVQVVIPYNAQFSKLRSEMVEDPTYRALFEYVFPLDRFVALTTIYTAEYVSGLPGRAALFDGTKARLRKMYYDVSLTNDNQNWWKKTKYRGDNWWEQPLDLSVPGILFMTPYKILQALLILVPPLNWFLDGLLSTLPSLPPHRSKRGDPCD
jgi:hypothetical protein